MQSRWEDAQAVIADAVAQCVPKPLMVAVGATAHLGVPRALASQGWLSDAAMVTVGAVRHPLDLGSEACKDCVAQDRGRLKTRGWSFVGPTSLNRHYHLRPCSAFAVEMKSSGRGAIAPVELRLASCACWVLCWLEGLQGWVCMHSVRPLLMHSTTCRAVLTQGTVPEGLRHRFMVVDGNDRRLAALYRQIRLDLSTCAESHVLCCPEHLCDFDVAWVKLHLHVPTSA